MTTCILVGIACLSIGACLGFLFFAILRAGADR